MRHFDQRVSLFLLPLGGAVVFLNILLAPPEKTAIVVSVIGLFALLAGLYWVGGNIDAKLPGSSLFLLFVLVVCVLISVLPPGLTPSLTSPITLSIALLTLLPLSRSKNISGVHIALLAVFLGTLGSYEVLYYYPLNLGIDAWSYLAGSSVIVQTGHYSATTLPKAIDVYYSPFPIMSIAPSMFATITGLDVTMSLFLFPGLLIVLQPLFIFLLARSMFGIDAAPLSALTVVSEATVTRWINAPLAESVALSLMLLVLLVLNGRMSIGRLFSILILFPVLAALHGVVALMSVFLFWFLIPRNRLGKGAVRILTLVFLGYLAITAGTIRLFLGGSSLLSGTLGSTFGFSSTTPTQVLFAGSSSGLPFIWWGFPVALTLILFFLDRKKAANWIYSGLGLLGLSFVANLIAPGTNIDRYGGLTAWLILAVASGRALSLVTKTPRQALLAIPILMLVFSSSMIDPTISPQYGIVHGYVLPTSIADREALSWLSTSYVHTVGYITVTNDYARAYLLFAQFTSGSDYNRYIGAWNPHYLFLPGSSNVLFARSSDFPTEPSGVCAPSMFLTSNQNAKVNIVFSNGCGIVAGSP